MTQHQWSVGQSIDKQLIFHRPADRVVGSYVFTQMEAARVDEHLAMMAHSSLSLDLSNFNCSGQTTVFTVDE